MKYLLSEIDQTRLDSSLKNQCKNMLLDAKPGKSKWSNPNRVGQDELYQGLEKVLLDLKSYTVRERWLWLSMFLSSYLYIYSYIPISHISLYLALLDPFSGKS